MRCYEGFYEVINFPVLFAVVFNVLCSFIHLLVERGERRETCLILRDQLEEMSIIIPLLGFVP